MIIELIILEVEDLKKVLVKLICGCIVVILVIKLDSIVLVKVKYNECVLSFVKILEVYYNNVKIGIIKIIGKCK